MACGSCMPDSRVRGAPGVSVFLSVIAALLLDALLGEPKRAHPLVAFGRLADRLERHFNGAAGP